MDADDRAGPARAANPDRHARWIVGDGPLNWLLRVITDRRLTAEGDGTRVEATIEMQLDRPFRRPMQAVRTWLYRGAAQQEFEHQLALIAKRIEARRQP